MKNDMERMDFVLRFMQTELDGVREGDLLNLREDMVTFLEWGPRWREDISIEDVKPLQEEIARVLHAIGRTFAPRTPGDHEADLPRILKIGEIPTTALFRQLNRGRKGIALKIGQPDFLFFDVSEEGQTRLLVSASLRDAFFISVLSLLSRLDITYIRQCPSCSRLFYATHGRQIHCTSQCATREGTRRFRAAHRKQENERRRINYEKKVKKKLGPNVRIGKRKNQPDEEEK